MFSVVLLAFVVRIIVLSLALSLFRYYLLSCYTLLLASAWHCAIARHFLAVQLCVCAIARVIPVVRPRGRRHKRQLQPLDIVPVQRRKEGSRGRACRCCKDSARVSAIN